MNGSKGIVYLAGPIICNLEGYHGEYNLARQLVKKAGYTPVSSDFLPLGLRESDYMRISLAILESADMVIALKGWTASQGAQIEWAYGQRTGKKCVSLQQFCTENHVLENPECGGRHEAKG